MNEITLAIEPGDLDDLLFTLVRLRETWGQQRVLKSFTFAESNGTGDWRNGKLWKANRYHYVSTDSQRTDLRRRLPGHQRDLGNLAGVGDDLDYMHARHYTPLSARFLSTDPRTHYQPLKLPQRWNRYIYSIDNPLKFTDRDGEDLTIVYDFSQTKMPDRAQTKVTLNVRRVFIKAGVRNVQSLFKGGSSKPKSDKPTDRVVHVKVTDKIIRSSRGVPVYGETKLGNKCFVSTFLAPSGEAGNRLLVNVIGHEVGHGTGALPKYGNDSFPLGSPINPEGAEPGTIMEQGVQNTILCEEIREFSEEDAKNLRDALNEPLKR